MYTPIIGSTTFHVLLARFDRDLAAGVRARGCPLCEGPLDVSNYTRKPRGGPKDLPDECRIRNSLCCRREGCRTRRKPPSVIFLDRRVYTTAAIVLVSTLAEGATPRRLKSLLRMIGASRPTITRWQQWWRETFPKSEVGQLTRARLAGGLDVGRLPRSLLESVPGPLVERVAWVLRLLARQNDL